MTTHTPTPILNFEKAQHAVSAAAKARRDKTWDATMMVSAAVRAELEAQAVNGWEKLVAERDAALSRERTLRADLAKLDAMVDSTVAERDALKADLAESKKMLKVAAKRLSGTNIMGEEIEAKTLGRIRAYLARLDGKEWK